ncbi:MAG: hypothetical protein JW774_06165 [Candidatus Aureabacteria bacterium]|nr:hypothetical protein [Candidatus Auribacterota bacterium]
MNRKLLILIFFFYTGREWTLDAHSPVHKRLIETSLAPVSSFSGNEALQNSRIERAWKRFVNRKTDPVLLMRNVIENRLQLIRKEPDQPNRTITSIIKLRLEFIKKRETHMLAQADQGAIPLDLSAYKMAFYEQFFTSFLRSFYDQAMQRIQDPLKETISFENILGDIEGIGSAFYFYTPAWELDDIYYHGWPRKLDFNTVVTDPQSGQSYSYAELWDQLVQKLIQSGQKVDWIPQVMPDQIISGRSTLLQRILDGDFTTHSERMKWNWGLEGSIERGYNKLMYFCVFPQQREPPGIPALPAVEPCAYLVPDAEDKQVIFNAISQAVERELITREEGIELRKKVFTYLEYLYPRTRVPNLILIRGSS